MPELFDHIKRARIVSAALRSRCPGLRKIFRFDAIDLQGQNHLLSQYDSQKARVFVFLSTSCPIANSYTQELNRLSLIARDSVEFYGVVSEPM